ncbi:MAG TPA: hypothetical protein VLA34_00605, partial [Candidatus Krumholzibacterium sp.]|nr:hypothetical protein [Candidatus Krumholzibacterium sp.]
MMYARICFLVASTALLLTAAVLTGCTDGVFTGEPSPNTPPEIRLSSGPVEHDTTGYQVHFYWNAWDPDGRVSHFEFAVVDGDPTGFSPADTSGLEKWTSTSLFDSIFKVSADQYLEPYGLNPLYEVYDRTHTFFLRAVDKEGMRSEVVSRSFTAWTLSPFVEINRPEGRGRTYSTVITFGWNAWDPIDNVSNLQDPDFVRYLYSALVNHDNIYDPAFNLIEDLNENPEIYEDLWSEWIPYDSHSGSGTEVILGDDEALQLNRSYVFAVQAKDEAGAVTALMRKDHNARQFVVSFKAGPLLTVSEQHIGGSQFLGTQMLTVNTQLPPGIPLRFYWEADASSYGGEISGYRYGWDVQDLNDP